MAAHEPTLKDLCDQLGSDKVRERQDALATLRRTFSRGSAIEAVKSKGWTVVFSALQLAFDKELTICTKQGKLTTAASGAGATAIRRLGEVASTVREFAEKAVHLMTTKAVLPLLRHLVQHMKYRSHLLEPVAIHYIRAVHCIVDYPHHLNYLELKDPERWKKIVGLGFNVILGDLLNQDLEDMEAEEDDDISPGTPVSDGMDSDTAGEEDMGDMSQPTNTKKRRLPARTQPRSPTKTKARRKEVRSASQEQVAFAAVLAVLLKSDTAPLLDAGDSSLSSAILSRLSRFHSVYPGESTLHRDYLACVSGALSHFALNRKSEVSHFAQLTWNNLVAMWRTRTQSLKEELVIILRTLLPYLAVGLDEDRPARVTYEEGVNRLWKVLVGEAEKRGVEGLSLDSIRLQILAADEEGSSRAFVARTFRHGWHFDPSQALSWAILSLQTDCAEKLYQLSESVHSTTNDDGKRVKRENPISSLLSSVSSASSSARAYRLQSLLFFIDGHWRILHDDLRKGVISTLQHFLSLDDAQAQSWTFLCLAAVAHAESTAYSVSAASSQLIAEDSTTWNNIFAHAMRRVSVPAVCRAACHAAHTLLYHSKQLLTPHQVLVEIETLAKDLDVQGPSFPFDSACSFLALCMRVASQDVRLYRMQLEEKVLAWLVDTWRPDTMVKSRMLPHTVEDVLKVLGGICCVPRDVQVLCPMKLPRCPIVTAMVDEWHTRIIRDYLLYARLPDPSDEPIQSPSLSPAVPSAPTPSDHQTGGARELVQPRGRERRISTFLLKSLEDLLQYWDASEGGRSRSERFTAERTRTYLDLGVLSLLFEATLQSNGTRPNRRVQQASSKLLFLTFPEAVDSRWSPTEKVLILGALEPLILNEAPRNTFKPWESLLHAGVGSGVRRDPSRASSLHAHKHLAAASRRELQKSVFQNPDMQELVSKISEISHTVLKSMLSNPTDETPARMDLDDQDDFVTRSNTSRAAQGGLRRVPGVEDIVDICVAALSVLPLLQSVSTIPTRDKKLLDMVQTFQLDDWLTIGPAFIDNVRSQTLHLSDSSLEQIFSKFGDVIREYLAKPSSSQFLAIALLDATMHIWIANDRLLPFVEDLCQWLLTLFEKDAITSWVCRDRLLQFFSSYLDLDPAETSWSTFTSELPENSSTPPPTGRPSELIPSMGKDADIRVRFRVAAASAHLVQNASFVGVPSLDMYDRVRSFLSVDVEQYEHILTRLLCLSNVMIVSSAVRRGPLWHTLELCLHSQEYISHVETLLSGVAQRLDLPGSALFMAYASQTAFSLRRTDKDFLQLPARLLGFRDKRECAEATFSAFTPMNILIGDSPQERTKGRSLFKLHCQATKRTVAQGIKQCFAEIAGYQIVSYVHAHDHDDQLKGLKDILADRMKDIGDGYNDMLRQHVDGVVATLLRTLGDQDFSKDGVVSAALQNANPMAVADFRALTRYRHLQKFEAHEPNLPAYPATSIIRSLQWFQREVPSMDQPSTTYHVLHQLFAHIGQSPLINEQLRLITATSLWISLRRSDFQDLTTLRTLVNGAASTLRQPDLARAAQSLLEWCFSLYVQFELQEARLASVLIHICSTAHNYSMSSDPEMSTMGRDLLRWAEKQAEHMWKRAPLRKCITQALSVWPVELSPDLQGRIANASGQGVSAILNDGRISSNKFKLVRRLHDMPTNPESESSQVDFWTLKACIPARSQLSKIDTYPFCEYLLSRKGFASGLVFEYPSAHTVRTRHARGIKKRDNSVSSTREDVSVAQQAIVASLIANLDELDAMEVQLSYVTLRSLVSVMPFNPHHWPAETLVELGFLKDYCRTVKARDIPDLGDLVTNAIWIDVATDFRVWVVRVTPMLSDILSSHEPFYAPLASILEANPTFAEQVFPVLIHTLLQTERTGVDISEMKMRQLLSRYFDRLLRVETTDTPCRRLIVDTVLHLRYFVPTAKQDPMRNDALSRNKWLDVDFVLLSKNAITCGAYTTALLFLELAAEHNGLNDAAADMEQVMYDIYSHIDEPDGFYGIATQDLQKFLIQRFHHEKQWDKAFQFHGARLETRSTASHDSEGVLQALHAFGFDHLAMSTLHGATSGATVASSNMTYQLGWRTETWDLPERPDQHGAGASLYSALRAMYRERDPLMINKTLQRAVADEMTQLSVLGTESVKEIRQVIQNLMALHQVVRWHDHHLESSHHTHLRSVATVDDDFDFSDLETIVAVRLSLLRFALQKEQREQIGDMLSPLAQALKDTQTACLLRLSEAARQADQTQIAMNSVVRAQQISMEPTTDVSEEFSQVLWLMKEPKLAVQYLRQSLGHGHNSGSEKPPNSLRSASTLARLGRWTSEASLEKSAGVKAGFFDPAVNFLSSHSGFNQSQRSECATIYHQYAMFSERQYHAIVKSPDALRWKFYVERKRQELVRRQEELTKHQQGTPQYNLALAQVKATGNVLQEDQRQFQEHIDTRDSFLCKAIEMYSRALEASDAFDDDSPIRLCSLWFANFEYEGGNFQDVIGEALRRVPSHKFVFLAHQITARMTEKGSQADQADQENLRNLILRMCREHPFHSLYQVWCLQSERKSASLTRRQSARLESSSSQAARASAAGSIFDKLRSDESFTKTIRDVEEVCRACLEWATYPIKSRFANTKGAAHGKLFDGLSIKKLRNVRVPVLTAKTALDPTCRYDKCVYIESYEDHFTTAGGLNLPKITNCRGTDGNKYKQLFKGEGNDDLRQDAVMEQVFTLCNIILNRDRETRKRKLSVKDYRVIPLASQAGVLEFVTNTSPLRDIVNRLHPLYHPKDRDGQKMTNELRKHRDDNKNNPAIQTMQMELYQRLIKEFHPVMRHYFTEQRKTPMSWFRMRLKYSRSVATTSIVGHILGLGDRHTSNILLDNQTGEVVHIDLGIAFDQGKLLPVPERVPFRLTRDIVDGLGTTGTQGVFQRCAEETLRVLRAGSDVIVTVLEVFKYDPLHSWTASEIKVKRVQGTGDTGLITEEAVRYALGIDMTSGSLAEEQADRALNAVSRKLDKSMTVEYVVNELIAEATDIKNVANMFAGWGPHY